MKPSIKDCKNNLRRLSGENFIHRNKSINKKLKDKICQIDKDVKIVKINSQTKKKLKIDKNDNQQDKNSNLSQLQIEPNTSKIDSHCLPSTSKETQETTPINSSNKDDDKNQNNSKDSSSIHEHDLSNDYEIISLIDLQDLEEQSSTEKDEDKDKESKINENSLKAQAVLDKIGRKFSKSGHDQIDFVSELGHQQYVQMVLTDIFSYLSDKEIAASCCVSKLWRNVLRSNNTINARRMRHIRAQEEARRNAQMENWPLRPKDFKKNLSNRRAFGDEMTNKNFAINR